MLMSFLDFVVIVCTFNWVSVFMSFLDFVVIAYTFNWIITPSLTNPLPNMLILGSYNSAANKDVVSKERTNEDTIILLSRKHCGKMRSCS